MSALDHERVPLQAYVENNYELERGLQGRDV